MGWVVRAFLIIGGLIAFGLSHLVEPLYRAQPQILLSAPALLLPPRGLQTSIVLVLVLSALWMGESLFYRRVLGLEWRVAFRETVRTYTPLVLLLIYVPVLVPGRAPLPFIGWWLVVDARAWIATLVVACAIYLKVTFLAPFLDAHRDRWRRVSGSRLAFLGLVLGLLATLLASIPERRFTQPYDERWGTGDEPRYVRITASLLHDGDADVGNAEELIGKRPDPARALTHVATWIPATIGTAYEAAKSIFGIEPRGRVEWIGGPVLEGRKGGTFYVFLPGLPFLLTPSMAVDTFVNPDRLVFTLFTCLLLGTFCTLAIARLVEPAIGSRLGGVGLAFAIGVTPPLFFYHFQVYTEVTATICITLMLIAVLSTRLTLRWAIAFGLSGALLPWASHEVPADLGRLVARLLLERVSIESGMEVVRVGSDTFLSRDGPSVPLRLSHHRQFIARRPVGGERLSTRSDLSQPGDSAGSLLPSSGSRRGTSRLFASLSVCSSRCLGASPAVAVRFRVRPRDRRTVPLHGRVPRPGRLGCLGASRALPRSSRSGDGTLPGGVAARPGDAAASLDGLGLRRRSGFLDRSGHVDGAALRL